jgi:hypothetical protein
MGRHTHSDRLDELQEDHQTERWEILPLLDWCHVQGRGNW